MKYNSHINTVFVFISSHLQIQSSEGLIHTPSPYWIFWITERIAIEHQTVIHMHTRRTRYNFHSQHMMCILFPDLIKIHTCKNITE